MRYLSERQRVVEAFKFMEERGLNYGYSGNISVKVSDGEYLISASGLRKARMKPENVLLVDERGNVIEGEGSPSVELPLHVAVYRSRPDVRVVVHAHPLYATVLAVLRLNLEPVVEEMVFYTGGDVRVAEYATFGTGELARNVVEALGDRSAVLLANHGVLTCGSSLDEALDVLVCVERAAQIHMLAKAVGEPRLLPWETVDLERKIYLKRRGLLRA